MLKLPKYIDETVKMRYNSQGIAYAVPFWYTYNQNVTVFKINMNDTAESILVVWNN